MSENKFTPGPWRRNKYGEIVATNGGHVSFRGVSIMCAGSADRVTEAEANTDLAAAAPDLLQACERAVGWLEGWASAEPYITELQLAIAKARSQP